MDLQIQGDIRRSKRKLSVFLDLPDSSSLSQNSSISIPAEKKRKRNFFSQSQSTRRIKDIPIYSESPLSEDSESVINILKSQVFVEIPEKTSFDFSKYSPLSDTVYSRTPLGPKDINIQLSQTISDYIRKPDQKISWGCVKKWQKSQPNDHTSKFSIIYLSIYYTDYLPSSLYTR